MRSSPRIASLALATLAFSFAPEAHAIDKDVGTATGTCQHAETVTVGFGCTGVYVGNNTVITAGHCRDGTAAPTYVQFGEGRRGDLVHRKVPITSCDWHPSGRETTSIWDGSAYEGVDLMVCRLETGAPDVPVITPMVPTGCEVDYLRAERRQRPSGVPATIVGTGCEADYQNTPCTADHKRFVAPGNPANFRFDNQTSRGGSHTKLVFDSDLIFVAKSGDSGGPLYVRMADSTYRLIGVVHSSGVRDYAEAVPSWLHWIERAAMEDLTPCHDRDPGRGWIFHGGTNCYDLLVKDPELPGRRWQNDCQPNAAARSAFYGGGRNECAGWHPPLPLRQVDWSSSTAVAPAEALDAAVQSFEALRTMDGPLPPPTTCEETDAFFDDVLADEAYYPFLADGPGARERYVSDIFPTPSCPERR